MFSLLKGIIVYRAKLQLRRAKSEWLLYGYYPVSRDYCAFLCAKAYIPSPPIRVSSNFLTTKRHDVLQSKDVFKESRDWMVETVSPILLERGSTSLLKGTICCRVELYPRKAESEWHLHGYYPAS